MVVALFQENSTNHKTRYYSTILSNKVATDNGEWINIVGIHPFTVHVSGMTSGVIQLRGSNSPSEPSASSHEIQLGADIGTDGIYCVEIPVKWFKARISNYVSGTINAYFEAFL